MMDERARLSAAGLHFWILEVEMCLSTKLTSAKPRATRGAVTDMFLQFHTIQPI